MPPKIKHPVVFLVFSALVSAVLIQPLLAEELISLQNNDIEKPKLKTGSSFKTIDGKLGGSQEEEIQQIFTAQKESDIRDLKLLWDTTVERNSVIKFAVRKLSLPANQRRVHSSMMGKTLSTLISGATILPGLFGADSMTSSASWAGGKLAKKYVNDKTALKEMPLTDTELIQLAELVERLQNQIIKSYYEYKSSIENLQTCRQNILIHNRNYGEALKRGDEINIIALSALYDKELKNELELKQKIKLYRLDLERLAGLEAVDKLSLNQLQYVR